MVGYATLTHPTSWAPSRRAATPMPAPAVLRRFAARPVIYPDSNFAATYDRRARANLAPELAALI
ncbi:putative metal-dependent HD superfamily phosphohydrolase [Bradyrhizobium sp. USDA 4459]